MKTKQITISELKSVVKKIIKENYDTSQLHPAMQGVYDGEQHTVKIIKCSNDKYWYKNYINQEFDVVQDKENENRWALLPNQKTKIEPSTGGMFYIYKEDTNVIN